MARSITVHEAAHIPAACRCGCGERGRRYSGARQHQRLDGHGVGLLWPPYYETLSHSSLKDSRSSPGHEFSEESPCDK